MAWRSPDLTPMDFLLWGFVKDSVYVPPLQTILHELKTRLREACAKIDHEILRNMWLEVDFGLMLLELLVAFTLSCINWSFSSYVF